MSETLLFPDYDYISLNSNGDTNTSKLSFAFPQDAGIGDDNTMSSINNERQQQQSPSSFDELYRTLLFLLALYVAGDLFCGKLLKIVPSLVGQIIIGVLFGPYVWDLLSSPHSFQTLGELGLVLLLCQAGLEMDFQTLKKIGFHGVLMAFLGSLLPTSIGFMVSYFGLQLSFVSSLAVGCSFGPTSAGIAMNVLAQCHVLKTHVGQLIVAIAIVDDIIALVVLSQLRALTTTSIENHSSSSTTRNIAIPIVSAFLWLFVGGIIALYGMPKLLNGLEVLEEKIVLTTNHTTINDSKTTNNSNEIDDDDIEIADDGNENDNNLKSFSLLHVIILLFALLPATYYTEASYLLGAFLAGLSCCQAKHSSAVYNEQLDTIIVWFMRIFFGATIAFEVPVTLFFKNPQKVIGTGFLLSLALLGKIITGPLLTPVLTQGGRRYDKYHIRDCMVVGFSMAGEAEFAFLVAKFGFSEGLFEESIYASVVFAILLSTVLSPILLRLTIALFPYHTNTCTQTNHEIESNGSEENSEQQEKEVILP